MLWQQPVGQNSQQTGYYLFALADDAVYLAGRTQTIDGSGQLGVSNVVVRRLDKSGATVWSQTYDAGEPTLYKWPVSVGVGATGV